MEIEKLKSESDSPKKQNGGARPGAGRPKGKKSPATIEREEAAKQFRERVAKNVNKLFNAQLNLATGTQMLFMIKTDSKGNRRKPEIVTDIETISRFLDENEGVDGTLGDDDTEYYFMTTARPDNSAIQGLLDRSFGKATEKVESDVNVNVNNNENLTPEEIDERIRDIISRRAN